MTTIKAMGGGRAGEEGGGRGQKAQGRVEQCGDKGTDEEEEDGMEGDATMERTRVTTKQRGRRTLPATRGRWRSDNDRFGDIGAEKGRTELKKYLESARINFLFR